MKRSEFTNHLAHIFYGIGTAFSLAPPPPALTETTPKTEEETIREAFTDVGAALEETMRTVDQCAEQWRDQHERGH